MQTTLQHTPIKPKPLTLAQIEAGGLPAWCEAYAAWLSTLNSFLNQNNRAGMGRIRALRSLRVTLETMLPASFNENAVEYILADIRTMALLKADSF
jgi:hypothetical protein